jgi:hypothetical protein
VPRLIDLDLGAKELTFPTLLEGVNVTLTADEESWTVGNGGSAEKVRVVDVLEARNGRVLVLDGVLEVEP